MLVTVSIPTPQEAQVFKPILPVSIRPRVLGTWCGAAPCRLHPALVPPPPGSLSASAPARAVVMCRYQPYLPAPEGFNTVLIPLFTAVNLYQNLGFTSSPYSKPPGGVSNVTMRMRRTVTQRRLGSWKKTSGGGGQKPFFTTPSRRPWFFTGKLPAQN